MEFFADWHIHTTYSDGRGTLEENVEAAVNRGLDQIAITDHGPANMGGVGVKGAQIYQEIRDKLESISQDYGGITVLTGAEANILSLDGTIDLPKQVIGQLDILAVGLHPYVRSSTFGNSWSVVALNQIAQFSRRVKEKARINNTKALKESLLRYDIDFISHPNLRMPVDITELATACVSSDTALEINTGHRYDKDSLVRTAAGTGVNFVVNSDAHFPKNVGNLASGGMLLEKYNIPPDRILNARKDRC